MDDQPRQCLTHTEEEFMRTIVAQIVAFLETNRQALESIQTRRMMKGLTKFISQSETPQWRESTSLPPEYSASVSQNAYNVVWNQRNPVESLSRDQSENTTNSSLCYEGVAATDKMSPAARHILAGGAKSIMLEDRDYQTQSLALKMELLRRAAVSIVDCLHLHEPSSVIFYNVQMQVSQKSSL